MIPGLARGQMPTEQSLEIIRANHVEEYRLRAETTIRQIVPWLQATTNFENDAESLRRHFSDRLRIVASQLRLEKGNLQLAIGKESFPLDLSWGEIEAMVNGLLDKMFPQGDYQEEVALMLGFPAEKYEDLLACIKQGVEMEAGAKK